MPNNKNNLDGKNSRDVQCNENIEIDKNVENDRKIVKDNIEFSEPCPIYVPMNYKTLSEYKSLIKPLYNEPVLIFDIDSTLYPGINGLEDEMRKVFYNVFLKEIAKQNQRNLDKNYKKESVSNVHKEKSKLKSIEIKELVLELNRIYGFTMRGMMKELGLDLTPFKEELNAINHKNFVEKDLELGRNLRNIKIRKICFTNAGILHAKKVLKCLELEDCFEVVVTTDTDYLWLNEANRKQKKSEGHNVSTLAKEFLERNRQYHGESNVDRFNPKDPRDFICKPDPQAYKFIEDLFEIKPPNASESLDIAKETCLSNVSALKGGSEEGLTINQSGMIESIYFNTRKNVFFFDDAHNNIKQAEEFKWHGIHVLNDKYIGDLINDALSQKLVQKK